MQPIPNQVVLGTLFDFIITIPLLTYFFIIRKRYSWKNVLFVALLGYLVASQIIPHQMQSSYHFIKYIFTAIEGIFVLIELYIGYNLVKNISAIIHRLKNNPTNIPSFQHRLEETLMLHLKPSRSLDIISSELTMLYYSLFSWRKKQISSIESTSFFTFHKKTSFVAFYVMIIHALVLESIGFHFILHSWSPLISFITLFLNVYTVLILLAEIQAIRLCPIFLTNQHVYFQIGIMKRLTVSFDDIKSVHYYQGPEKIPAKESKHIFDGVLSEFMKEKPTLEIELHTPKKAKFLYGFSKNVTKVHLRPDEPQRFYEALTTKLYEEVNL
jgi:membrane protein YdbS with pleckstrin-like domain